MSNIDCPVRIKKPPFPGGLKNKKTTLLLLTQGYITGNRQNQNPLFVERKRNPEPVIKPFHYLSEKPSGLYLFITHSLYPNGLSEGKKNHLSLSVSACQQRVCITKIRQVFCGTNQASLLTASAIALPIGICCGQKASAQR